MKSIMKEELNERIKLQDIIPYSAKTSGNTWLSEGKDNNAYFSFRVVKGFESF